MTQKSMAPAKFGRIERYKVAFIDPLNLNTFKSEMHRNLESAVAAGERENAPYLVMEMKDALDGNYTWEVLPHGFHGHWTLIQKAYANRWQIGIGLASGLLAGLILLAGDDKKPQYAPTFDLPE
jgi:hypothetical protein